MDFIKRKVFLTKDLRPYDSDGDGVFNALVLSATTKHIQIPIRHSFDDIGIYEVADEESFEIIDIGSFFDGSFTGVTQPSGTPSVTGNTWNGGGDAGNGGSNDTEIPYCNDTTANNYTTVTYSSGGAIVTPANGTPTTYTAPLPTFTVDNSLCVYDNATGGSTGTGPSSPTGFGIQTLFNGCKGSSAGNSCGGNPCITPIGSYWTTLSSWSAYSPYALTNAINHCKALYGNTTATVLTNGDFGSIPQGDCTTAGSLAFAGVKLDQSWGGYYCCTSNCGTDDETGVYTYRYKYCFYCKEQP